MSELLEALEQDMFNIRAYSKTFEMHANYIMDESRKVRSRVVKAGKAGTIDEEDVEKIREAFKYFDAAHGRALYVAQEIRRMRGIVEKNLGQYGLSLEFEDEESEE